MKFMSVVFPLTSALVCVACSSPTPPGAKVDPNRPGATASVNGNEPVAPATIDTNKPGGVAVLGPNHITDAHLLETAEPGSPKSSVEAELAAHRVEPVDERSSAIAHASADPKVRVLAEPAAGIDAAAPAAAAAEDAAPVGDEPQDH